MKKPYWLKTYYLKYKINIIFFNIFQFFIPKNKTGNKILITELDGIGDIVVRQKLVDEIAEKYGKENIILLITYAAELIELSGYKYEVFEKDTHYNFFKLLKLFKKLCMYDFRILYSLEFISEDKLDFLRKMNFQKIYAFERGWLDNWKDKKNIVFVEKNGEKVLDKIHNYATIAVNADLIKEDLKPQLNLQTSEGNYIAVGVGASDKKKITFPEKLSEFLETIVKDYSDMKFHILGHGKNDIEYFQKLEKVFSKRENLVCLVNKLSLAETAKQIANAGVYIGFDSGLYNIAYALQKKQICMISTKRGQEFYHKDENIKFIYKELNTEIIETTNEPKYNNDISSISPKIFKEAFDLTIGKQEKGNDY
ncbi:glycosyltransferase family 9 protein [Sebaldella sp. S0638]|uniref:glycosyltransferase family 9 protein n=1 Tax=Sebaldella sp. S0638 TaxID=2957809 RepID=UPI00209CCC04|nr:glycosyltransferase family 9 protein [Sebaldella sp. S0638]MCP1223115.1 hypothetical protein [Sebaldella sp. S0638]